MSGKHVVAVQMGHVGVTRGSTGAPREQEFNSKLGPKIQALGQQRGYTVHLLKARDKVPTCDLYISLHCDGNSNKGATKASVGYPPTSAPSKEYAALWKKTYGAIYPLSFRSDNYTNNLRYYYGYSMTKARAKVLVEHGFITNPGEQRWLFANLDAIAAAHVATWDAWFKVQPAETNKKQAQAKKLPKIPAMPAATSSILDSTPFATTAAGLSVLVNTLTLVHRGSQGVSVASLPNVCLVPGPTSPFPTPLPNVARSSNLAGGSKRVTADGGNSVAVKGSCFTPSSGDAAGSLGGVASGTFSNRATWLLHAFNVLIEGRGAARLTDKMLMNQGNTGCLGGELQASLAAALALARARPEPTTCATWPIKLSCKHKKRGREYAWPGEPTSLGLSKQVGENIFQVVAGPEMSKADIVIARTNMKKPACGLHSDQQLTTDAEHFEILSPVKLQLSLTCDAYYAPIKYLIAAVGSAGSAGMDFVNGRFASALSGATSTISSVATLWDLFWPAPARVKQTTVTPRVCNPLRPSPVIVEVYPDLQWSVDLRWGKKLSREWNWPEKRGGKEQSKELSLSASVTVASVEYDISIGMEKHVNTLFSFLDLAKRVTKKIISALSKIGAAEIEVLWPQLGISGKWGYEEHGGSNAVDFPLDIKVGAKPFIGLEGRADILDLVRSLPVVGEVIYQAKKRLHKGLGEKDDDLRAQATIAIWLKAGASVSGEAFYRRKIGAGSTSVGGKFKGRIPLTIEPEVSFELSILLVKCSAGIKGGGRGGFFLDLEPGIADDKPYFKGALGALPLELYYVAYIKADAKVSRWKPKVGMHKEGTAEIWEGWKWDFGEEPAYVFRK